MIKTVAKKSFIQVRRDKIMLILTLLCAPFFIFLYKMIFLEGMSIYPVALYSNTSITSTLWNDFSYELKNKTYPGGGRLFDIVNIDDYQYGITLLKKHDVKIMVSIKDLKSIEIIGDFSDPYYVISSNLIEKHLNDYIKNKLTIFSPVSIIQKPIGISRDKTEFENYVPGLIIFSILIQLYLFVMLLLKEKQSGVFIRYSLCSLPRSSYIIGHTIIFSSLSLIGLLLTTITAYLLGFQSPNSVLYDISISIFVCFILNFGVIGLAFIVSGLTNSLIHGLLLSTFPFMIMVFFSGSVYPFPGLFIFKIIPATHAVNILHKILTYGTSPLDLVFDFILLLSLSLFLLIMGFRQVKY
ncbi:MAG: ABC transporter permease [Spirochaetaceae bacterium]